MSRKLKTSLKTLSVLLVLYAAYSLYFAEQGNFYAITPGSAYRSAQLDRDELEHYIKKHRIKSILNLRNDSAGSSWYAEETKISAEHQLAYYSVPLSAKSEPSEKSVANLLKVFNSAPRPILIHCRAGADRTGLVAAMWKAYVDKEPKEQAGKQLSIRFFHFPIGRAASLDRFFEKWQPAAAGGAESRR
jgi:undecaprenyl-diphosphatase